MLRALSSLALRSTLHFATKLFKWRYRRFSVMALSYKFSMNGETNSTIVFVVALSILTDMSALKAMHRSL
jgi:hypothetical protein